MTDDDIQASLTEAEEAYEAEQWAREQAETRWAEAGGYASGLARPAIRQPVSCELSEDLSWML